MKINKIILFLLFIVLFGCALGQTAKISGKVVDAKKNVNLDYALITLSRDSSKKIIHTLLSDDNGGQIQINQILERN